MLVVMYTEGIGVEKSLTWATYWLLRSGLSADERKIDISVSNYSRLLKNIPNILDAFDEFQNVKLLTFNEISAVTVFPMISMINQLIEENPKVRQQITTCTDTENSVGILEWPR